MVAMEPGNTESQQVDRCVATVPLALAVPFSLLIASACDEAPNGTVVSRKSDPLSLSNADSGLKKGEVVSEAAPTGLGRTRPSQGTREFLSIDHGPDSGFYLADQQRTNHYASASVRPIRRRRWIRELNDYALVIAQDHLLLHNNGLDDPDDPKPETRQDVASYDIDSFRLQWRTTAPGKCLYWEKGMQHVEPLNHVAVSKGAVYFAGRYGEVLVSVGLEDGKTRWERSIDGATIGAPLVTEDRVLVYSIPVVRKGSVPVSPGPVVTAVDRRSGRIAWRLELKAPRSIPWPPGDPTTIMTLGSKAVFVQTGERLSSLDPATGKLLWSREVPESGTLTYADGLLVGHNSNDGCMALHADTGALVWRNKEMTCRPQGRAVVKGKLFAAGKSLIALDVRTGVILHQHALARRPCCPVVIGVKDTVIVGSVEGDLEAFDTASASLRWSYKNRIRWPFKVRSLLPTRDGLLAVYQYGGLHRLE